MSISLAECLRVLKLTLSPNFCSNVYGEYGPTCSIIGGMIAQEVIKSLSKDPTSAYSIYFFNHLRCQMTGVLMDDEHNIQPVSNDSIAQSNDNNVMEIL